MRKLWLASAVLLVMGALAVAQTGPTDHGQTSAMNSQQVQSGAGQKAMDPSTAQQIDLNSPDSAQPDFRGTELEKAYQQEPQTGWQDPNIIRSGSLDQAGGAQ